MNSFTSTRFANFFSYPLMTVTLLASILMLQFQAVAQYDSVHYVPPFYTDFERVSISGNYVLEQAPPNQPMNMK